MIRVLVFFQRPMGCSLEMEDLRGRRDKRERLDCNVGVSKHVERSGDRCYQLCYCCLAFWWANMHTIVAESPSFLCSGVTGGGSEFGIQICLFAWC